ncbi:hypothetical protein V8E52_005983 [Russula decolorans]
MVYENQRWWMGLDWTAALLPGDRPSWCSASQAAFALPAPTTAFLPVNGPPDACEQRTATWAWAEPEWRVVVRRDGDSSVDTVEGAENTTEETDADTSASPPKKKKARSATSDASIATERATLPNNMILGHQPMSPFREQFVTNRCLPTRPIIAGNNEVSHAVDMGDLGIQVPNGATSTSMLMRGTCARNVLYRSAVWLRPRPASCHGKYLWCRGHGAHRCKGPLEPLSLSGRKYYATFADDHTRYTRPEIVRTEEQVLGAYKVFATWVQLGAVVLRGVLQPPTPRSILAWSSCSNRWLLERVRAMLHQADLLKTLWAEATHFAV